MNRFLDENESSNAIQTLQEEKKRIKDLVINPDLNWSKRAELYKQVQMINTQIEELSYRSTASR